MVKVLIVDDAAFMRASLRLMLEKNGYKIVGEAENGYVAVKKFKELSPDIVTMDITMPEMDGLQALKIIRSIDQDAKIIVISALGQEPMIKDAVMSGAKGFIVKPFKEEFVLEALKKVSESK